MKLLANENILMASVLSLRDAGYDVLSLSETTPGINDKAALTLACEQRRILVTFDRDYGSLIYGHGLPSPPAVVYLRFIPRTPAEPAEIVHSLLVQSVAALEGYCFVVERDSFRRRPLPVAAEAK
ncbi:MAG: DUF5615 family PIN-like protein [Acidobacteriaceae bacterium]